MQKRVNVGLVGHRFMGKAHSNAYRQVCAFFDPQCLPQLERVCGRDEKTLSLFADRFGWNTHTTRWQELVECSDIELIDICASNDLHAPIANEAARAGKAVFCEKPLARNLTEASEMLDAVTRANVPHMVCFNYRFLPAVVLAKRMIDDGAIGDIRQFRAIYLQDWLVDPLFPFSWRVQKEKTGFGALNDIGVHIADLARYLVGEIEEVSGLMKTFITKRPVPGGKKKERVTVDDTASFLARFSAGAVGVFESTRMAPGRRNFMHIEANGSKGSLHWNIEDLNVLRYYSEEDDETAQGFRHIIATDQPHPYAKYWWPPGHTLGYQHSFVHVVYELMNALGENRMPVPNFEDGARAQAILEAVSQSAEKKKWFQVPDIY